MRETLNNGVLQRLADVNQEIALGDLLGLMIDTLAPTEAAAVPVVGPSWDELTLANQANRIYLVDATAGVFTGVPALIIDSSDARIPKPGEVLWDGPGSTRLRFNSGDAVTAADLLYSRTDGANIRTALLERILGQRD